MWRGRALAAAVALEGRLGEVGVRARLGHEVEGLPRRRGGGEHGLARRLALARRRLARVRARQLLDYAVNGLHVVRVRVRVRVGG